MFESDNPCFGEFQVFADPKGRRRILPRRQPIVKRNFEDEPSKTGARTELSVLISLKPFENDLLNRIYVRGESLHSIGRDQGLYPSTIKRRHEKALDDFRRKIESKLNGSNEDDVPPAVTAKLPRKPKPDGGRCGAARLSLSQK